MGLTPEQMNQVADCVAAASHDWKACHWDAVSNVAVVMDDHCGIPVAVIGERLTVVGRDGFYADNWQAAYCWIRDHLYLGGEDAGSSTAVATALRHRNIDAAIESIDGHTTVVVTRKLGTIHAHATSDDYGTTITVSCRGSVSEADRLVITHSVTDAVEAIHHTLTIIDRLM